MASPSVLARAVAAFLAADLAFRYSAGRAQVTVVVQPDARMRRIMGTNTMVAAKRPPVALAARDFAGAVLGEQAPWLGH